MMSIFLAFTVHARQDEGQEIKYLKWSIVANLVVALFGLAKVKLNIEALKRTLQIKDATKEDRKKLTQDDSRDAMKDILYS